MKRFVTFLVLAVAAIVPLALAQVYDQTTGQQKVIVTTGGGGGTTAVCTGTLPINQTGTTDLHTFVAKGHICSMMLVSASAQGISLAEGTGSNCGTGTAYLMGGSGGTLALGANGGISMVAAAPWINMGTAADHLCLIQSASGNVSGTITYSDN